MCLSPLSDKKLCVVSPFQNQINMRSMLISLAMSENVMQLGRIPFFAIVTEEDYLVGLHACFAVLSNVSKAVCMDVR